MPGSALPSAPQVLFISLLEASGAVYLFKRILEERGIAHTHIVMGRQRFLTVLSAEVSDADIELLADRIRDIAPTVIAFSITTTDAIETVEKIVKRIRTVSRARIIAGGVGATVEPERVIAVADAVCVGEGIEPFAEFIDAFSRGEDRRDIKNFWFRDGTRIIRNELRPWMAIDHYPRISFEGYHNNIYRGFIEKKPEPPYAYIFCSLGCPMKCTFCTSPYLSALQPGGSVRIKSVAHIMDELRYYKSRAHRPGLFFLDEIFLWNDTFLDEFCRAYKDQIDMPFGCWGHPSFITAERIEKLKEAGLKLVVIGMQSCSTRIRKIFGRPETDAQIIAAARVLKDHHITFAYDLILSPLDTWRDHLAYFRLMPKIRGIFAVVIHSYCMLPKTKLREYLIENKIVAPQSAAWRRLSTFSRPQGKHKFWQMAYVLYFFLTHPVLLFRLHSLRSFIYTQVTLGRCMYFLRDTLFSVLRRVLARSSL